MKGKKIGSPFGIELFVHWTFWLLIIFVFFTTLPAGIAGTIGSISLVVAVFGCVVLHELGHSLMARRFGIQTSHITLLPIGGVAHLTRMPKDSKQELLIAIAGPAVNIGIALLLFPLILLMGLPEIVSPVVTSIPEFFLALLAVNVMLVVFNLLPIFPMDGGRILRAGLGFKMSFPKATRIASKVGQIMAIAMGAFALFNGIFMLTVLSIYVYLAAGRERRMVDAQEAWEQRQEHGIPNFQSVFSRFAVTPHAEGPRTVRAANVRVVDE